MIIKKSRIRSLKNNIHNVKVGDKITIAIPVECTVKDVLINCGFSSNLEEGESILPKSVGNITNFNANGKYIKHKDQKKEVAYRQAEWRWKDWGGNEHSKTVDIPYKRYPRTFVEPPSVELTMASKNNNLLVISPEIEFNNKNEPLIIHVINMFLELFNEAHILNSNLDNIIRCPIKKLNWEILPSGEMPFKKVRGKILEMVKSGNRPVITNRLDTINKHSPNFIAMGKAGFSGYLIFAFPKNNIYILESNEVNNATYIIDSSYKWEKISAFTKAEILNKNLHRERIIHRENWFNRINYLLNSK
jgi:hypothetical protein